MTLLEANLKEFEELEAHYMYSTSEMKRIRSKDIKHV
jgi:hypothetical protein